jgi:hypothetical protein
MTIVIAAAFVPAERRCMNAKPPTTDQLKDQHEESTYALLIRSKEKKRDLLELTIHPTLMLGAVLAIWQLVQQPVNIPAAGLEGATCVVCANKSQMLPEDRYPQIKG